MVIKNETEVIVFKSNFMSCFTVNNLNNHRHVSVEWHVVLVYDDIFCQHRCINFSI